jgi:hypothetical protein
MITMMNICCRVCGKDLKVMAVCINCGRAILYGCLKCSIFSDTKIHVDCLSAVSAIMHSKDV